jgi:hypothetical protein
VFLQRYCSYYSPFIAAPMRKRKLSIITNIYITSPAIYKKQRTYFRRCKQQVLQFLLYHRIPINGNKVGRPLSDEPLIEEPGYKKPIFSEAADYFRIKSRLTVGNWWRQKNELLKGYKPKKHTPKWPHLEKELVRLFTIARKRNKIVTMHWFQRTAAEV